MYDHPSAAKLHSPKFQQEAYGFMFYFTFQWRFFSTFPHGTTSPSVTQEFYKKKNAHKGDEFKKLDMSVTKDI